MSSKCGTSITATRRPEPARMAPEAARAKRGEPGMSPDFAIVHANGVPRIFDSFRRWPVVPSSQLLQLRSALLHCMELSGPETGRELSDAARKLLRLVTGELERRQRHRHT